MKNFIKQNWFKGIISVVVLIIGVSIAWYFFVYMPQYQEDKLSEQKIEQASNDSLANQQKCANSASSFIGKNGYSTTNSVRNGYISHWNKTLDKCFIEFSDGVGNNDIIYELADAIENTEYAEVQWTIPNEDKTGWCTLYPNGNGVSSETKDCHSKAEFDNFVKPFMND